MNYSKKILIIDFFSQTFLFSMFGLAVHATPLRGAAGAGSLALFTALHSRANQIMQARHGIFTILLLTSKALRLDYNDARIADTVILECQ